jgi:hypothetical protein
MTVFEDLGWQHVLLAGDPHVAPVGSFFLLKISQLSDLIITLEIKISNISSFSLEK